MALSNKGDSIIVFTLVTFFSTFFIFFLLYVPRWIYLSLKVHKKIPPIRSEMKQWFERGVEATYLSMGRRKRVGNDTRRARIEDGFRDIELGDISRDALGGKIRGRGRVVVALPQRAVVSGERLPGQI
ncbi:predicted protein [Sclerotinia sclerotiorum 1980 UF-70]|uniref:Uncharacterized protein n=1 Tax=Sclerotinia sclerotiorum (strain ATCC 18683 / 1980 / Ss-1) TaxID=665079 RepID=A7F246_SCLS1|nr:predicted protein [Sclerotinia sclerotiorum 1980 UF-70]EDN95788.1 predicted protein [Sclerotinia sclerotiorum 1980 UF-70]